MNEGAKIIDFEADEVTHKTGLQEYSPKLLKAAYSYCQAITASHYENFPVASFIMPKSMRPAVQAIYAFSRIADDFADEREFRQVRLERLDEWQELLQDTSSPATHPVFMALHDTIHKYQLPKQLLVDLVTAFKMDVYKSRYTQFSEVLHYCRHSANPVGRLVLHLFKQADEQNLVLSDCICTALQLTNFWQDVAVDLLKDRIYLPQEDLDKYDVAVRDLFAHKYNNNFKRLMEFEVERTRQLFLKGKPLGMTLPGQLGVEIRLTWLTGVTILKKISAIQFDVFNKRPVLSKMDFIKLFFVALSRQRYNNFKL